MIRAFRARVGEWSGCYEAVACRGEAEPARVAMRFTVQGDGGISDATIASVTEYCRRDDDIVEVRGDPEGALARCLLEVAHTTRVEVPRSLAPLETGFVFRPEMLGCSRHRPGGPCETR